MPPRFLYPSRWIAALVAVMLATPAVAQLEITITSAEGRQIPAAFVPFGWQGTDDSPPFDIAALVEQDLKNSGYFDPIDRRDMISRPTQGTQINFQDWRIVDVDVLLIGQLVQAGPDQFDIAYQLFDVVRGEPLIQLRRQARRDDLRAVSHLIADEVYEEMTGIPGIFSTRIAYVTEERSSPDDRKFSLIVADADGANAATIAESSQPLMSPAWSPDGRRIAYVSFEDQHSAIYVQTVATGTRERVSARAGINGAPTFSPDGRTLALTLSRDDGNLDIYTLDLGD
jgi:TolB protein